MELKIIEKKDNPLLYRLEIKFEVSHSNSKTPTRDEVRNLLAANLNSEKNRIIIDSMRTPFGSSITKGFAKIYYSVEDAMRIEPDYILIRNKLIEKKEEE